MSQMYIFHMFKRDGGSGVAATLRWKGRSAILFDSSSSVKRDAGIDLKSWGGGEGGGCGGVP